jgi:hypothetical protein
MTRDAIIAANPILAYCEARGWQMRRSGAEWSCRCPFPDHDDRTPSFFINPAKQLWLCRGCGRGGSVIDLHMGLHGINEGEAMRGLGGDDRNRHEHQPPPKCEEYDPFRNEEKAAKRAKWSAFDVPTKAEIKVIADLRGLSEEGVAIAAERGLLFCADSREGRVWIITDDKRVNAQARRLDGKNWVRIGDRKSWTLPGSVASWPVGIHEAQPFRAIALVEGGPDLLAAFHLAWIANQEANIAPVAMFGSMPISEQTLLLFKNKRVRLFGHYDDKAGAISETTRGIQLRKAGARIDRYDLSGFKTSNGMPVKDLCDFCHVDEVDQWEEDREAIDAAFIIG